MFKYLILIFKYINGGKSHLNQYFTILLSSCIFDQINAALVSIKYFLFLYQYFKAAVRNFFG